MAFVVRIRLEGKSKCDQSSVARFEFWNRWTVTNGWWKRQRFLNSAHRFEKLTMREGHHWIWNLDIDSKFQRLRMSCWYRICKANFELGNGFAMNYGFVKMKLRLFKFERLWTADLHSAEFTLGTRNNHMKFKRKDKRKAHNMNKELKIKIR